MLILLKPKILLREKMTLVDWHNHDNRLNACNIHLNVNGESLLILVF